MVIAKVWGELWIWKRDVQFFSFDCQRNSVWCWTVICQPETQEVYARHSRLCVYITQALMQQRIHASIARQQSHFLCFNLVPPASMLLSFYQSVSVRRTKNQVKWLAVSKCQAPSPNPPLRKFDHNLVCSLPCLLGLEVSPTQKVWDYVHITC